MAAIDTIVALSSAPGAAERAVVRLSGPAALAIAGSLIEPDLALVPGSTWARRRLALAGIGALDADVFVFRAPRSYTAEDAIELHVPGSAPIVQALLAALLAAGARPAGPGEFTRRAFLAGRLRLDQAEAVLQLIAARSEEAQRAAALHLRSAWADLPELRARFVSLLAVLEAYVDFTEEDTEALDGSQVASELRAIAQYADRSLAMLRVRPAAAPLAEVLLAGPRNAGKTSLFRLLVPGARAIVSPIPGSTRDLLEGVVRTSRRGESGTAPASARLRTLSRPARSRALSTFLQRATSCGGARWLARSEIRSKRGASPAHSAHSARMGGAAAWCSRTRTWPASPPPSGSRPSWRTARRCSSWEVIARRPRPSRARSLRAGERRRSRRGERGVAVDVRLVAALTRLRDHVESRSVTTWPRPRSWSRSRCARRSTRSPS
jgi:tRNA modification GTPase